MENKYFYVRTSNKKLKINLQDEKNTLLIHDSFNLPKNPDFSLSVIRKQTLVIGRP